MTEAPKYETNDPKGWMGDPQRGAALGRSTKHNTKDFTGKIYLREVLLDDGGYDRLGTYWGHGPKLFWYASTDGTIDAVTRAKDHDAACEVIFRHYPKAQLRRGRSNG